MTKNKNALIMYSIRRFLLYSVVLIIVAWIIIPYLWLVISSFSYKIDLLTIPLKWIPPKINLSHYKELFSSNSAISSGMSFFSHALLNSIVVTFGSSIISMTLGVLSAYAIARLRFTGQRFFLLILMISYMLPPIAIVLPGYLILKSLGLYDTQIGLILVDISFILPLVTWIMRGFFMGISRELEDAARIDGCSRLEALYRIVLPLSLPGIISTGIFAFIASWNEYLYAFIYTSSSARTLPVLLGEFTTKVGIDYLKMASAGVLTSLPPIILALIFQRFLINGLTEGAVKG